jgi:hypothetical protein
MEMRYVDEGGPHWFRASESSYQTISGVAATRCGTVGSTTSRRWSGILLELASYDGGNKTSITDQGVSARCNGKLCRLRPTQRVPRILQTCRRCRHAR